MLLCNINALLNLSFLTKTKQTSVSKCKHLILKLFKKRVMASKIRHHQYEMHTRVYIEHLQSLKIAALTILLVCYYQPVKG